MCRSHERRVVCPVTDPAPLPAPIPEYLALRFPAPLSQRPYVILNMVMSADGKAVAGETEFALSSPTDKLVLQSLRAHAGAILNGAGTARTTGVNPSIADDRLRRYRSEKLGMVSPPLQAIVSGSGDLDPHARFLQQDTFRVAVFVGEGATPEQLTNLRSSGKDVHVISGDAAGLAQLMHILHDKYSVELLLVEGGPTLNDQLFHAGLIDEMFVTVGPHIEGGRGVITIVSGKPFAAESMPRLELVSAYPSPSTSEVYLRWRVARRGAEEMQG
jgi:riboflavin-specific deaminase-like protein